MNLAFLERLGLSNAETKVYATLLRIGSTTVGPIVNEAQVARSKIYHVLDKLQRRGLVTSILKGDTKYFNAASPRKILDYIRYKKEDLDTLQKDAEKMMPQLEQLQDFAGFRDEAEIYRGKEGIKATRDISFQALKRGDTIRVFGSDQVAQDAMPAYWEEYHKKRVRAGIKAKYLMKESARNTLDSVKRKSGLLEIKYLPVSKPVYIDIFGDCVVTFVMAPDYYVSFLIKNKYIADFYREWFDELWEKGKS